MKRNIMLDIDGVVSDFFPGFAGYLNTHYGTQMDLNSEPNKYYWMEDLPNIPSREALINWSLQGGYGNLPIYEGAREFIEQLQKLANITIVTARVGDIYSGESGSLRDKIIEDTYAWFKKHNINLPGEIIFNSDKIPYCKENNLQIIIEDKLETVLKAAQEGLYSILINRGWNQHPARYRVFRANSYDDIIKEVKRLSL